MLSTRPRPSNFPSQLRYFATWLESEPLIAATLATLPELELSAEEWLQQNVRHAGDVKFPADEAQAVAVCRLVVRHVAGQEDVGSAVFQISVNFTHGSDDYDRSFLETFVEPMLTWLKERILKDDLVLHSLERYALEAAWFRRDELRSLYEADSRRGEKTLDRDLRHHLFRDGIDFPFSQTEVPSGRPDIVVPDEEAEPLPLEVKVYDPPRDRDAAWVRSGFAQAIEYAHDFRRADAYLAVFDVSEDGFAIAGDDPTDRLPHVRASGVTVFIVAVPIGAARPASRRGTAKRKALDSSFFRDES